MSEARQILGLKLLGAGFQNRVAVQSTLLFALACVVMTGGEAFAGCEIAGLHSSYHAYHHGRLEAPDQKKDRGGISGFSTPQWVYENGVLRRVDYPVSPPCDGPSCNQSPNDRANTIENTTSRSQSDSSQRSRVDMWQNELPPISYIAADSLAAHAGFLLGILRPPQKLMV